MLEVALHARPSIGFDLPVVLEDLQKKKREKEWYGTQDW